MHCHKIPISDWIKPLSYKKTELLWSITDIFPIYLWQKFSHIGIVRVKKMGSGFCWVYSTSFPSIFTSNALQTRRSTLWSQGTSIHIPDIKNPHLLYFLYYPSLFSCTIEVTFWWIIVLGKLKFNQSHYICLYVAFWPCQWKLIKTFQTEANNPLITKMALKNFLNIFGRSY